MLEAQLRAVPSLLFPLEARRAARLDKGFSARTVRVPWQGTLCVPCQVEFRSHLVESGSAGAPREYWARLQGRPSFGYFPWPRKASDQPPGCPRPVFAHEVVRRPKKTPASGRRSSLTECLLFFLLV